MKKIILLVGLTGSGKTTAGKYLEEKYNYHFLDVSTIVKGLFHDDLGLRIARDERLLVEIVKIITLHDKIVVVGLREEYLLEKILQQYPKAMLYELFVPDSIRKERALHRGLNENEYLQKNNIDDQLGVKQVCRRAGNRIVNTTLDLLHSQLDAIA